MKLFSLSLFVFATSFGVASSTGSTFQEVQVKEIKDHHGLSSEESNVVEALLLLKAYVNVGGVDTELLSSQETQFFTQCFNDALTLFDKFDDLHTLSVETHHETLIDNSRSLRVRPNMPRLHDFTAYLNLECRYCRRRLDIVSTSDYKNLEDAFCNELRNGPHQIFHHVNICAIRFDNN
jgi:hypothetical protein